MSFSVNSPQLPKHFPSLETQPKDIVMRYSATEIAEITKTLADKINAHYKGKNVLLIGILKGCLPFMADIIRHLEFDIEVDFVRLSSYGKGTESSGTITVIKDISEDISERNILIIEEIIDTGRTLKFLKERLNASNPADLKIATLFDKKSKRVVSIEGDFVGIEVPDRFLIGYGLDLAETCRNLPDVYSLEF